MNPDTVVETVAKGLAMFDDVERQAPLYPLDAVAEYEDWFRTEFVAGLLSRLTVVKGRWKADAGAAKVIGIAGRMAADGCRSILIPVLTHWLETQYPVFWKAGVEYASLMAAVSGLPKPAPMNEDDTGQIDILITGEIATQQDHVDHHRRYVERNVSAGLTLSWTIERFMEAMTVPQGIVGFPFGNMRYSWRTHITRMIQGRSRAVMAAAAENRAMLGVGE